MDPRISMTSLRTQHVEKQRPEGNGKEASRNPQAKVVIAR